MKVGAVNVPTFRRRQLCKQVTTTDTAKSVFQVHGIDQEGRVIIRRQLKRRYVVAFSRSCQVAVRDRGLRCVASLVTPTPGSGAYGKSDAAGLREALCEAAEERCCRR